jgi:hypothetical protein
MSANVRRHYPMLPTNIILNDAQVSEHLRRKFVVA